MDITKELKKENFPSPLSLHFFSFPRNISSDSYMYIHSAEIINYDHIA